MSLFMKQDFNPPLLSRRWVSIKFRPNMILYSRDNIIHILESGLLFREDSVDVEQESPAPEEVWGSAGGGKKGWLTRGERVASILGVAACVALFPPRSMQRSTLLNIAGYVTIPVVLRWCHRKRCRGSLPSLLAVMREYLALARRTAACLKEYAALHAQIGSLTSVIESTHVLLCRQQSELSVLLSRASSAVLGNAPWLRADVAWDAVKEQTEDNLMKIHHAFLVVQSTLLKHIAMAHFIPPIHAQRVYKNHNERIYWLHTNVIPHLTEEFQHNFDSLERMYRLLKNSGTKDNDVKKLGAAFNDSWIYSDIHTGIAKSCLELKLTLNKGNSLDVFLDSCAMNKQEIDLDVLDRDIDDIIDGLTKCLKTVQSSQLRLKKIQNKNVKEPAFQDKEVMVESVDILKIEDREPESKDEVFYFMKTDDDECVPPADDLTTAPGKKEMQARVVVLSELKRKLGKREDVMIERERQALAKTMPELKDIPEFPRQINLEEFIEKKGYIHKLKLRISVPKKTHLIKNKKIKIKDKKYKFKLAKYYRESDISGVIFEANAKLNVKSKLLTVNSDKDYCITKWCKYVQTAKKDSDTSGLSEGPSEAEASTANKVTKEIRFTKKDLELTPSSSESELEYYKEKQKALLNDVRRHRAVRKKNHPNHRPLTTDNVDESLKPIEYTFKTGMAMAAVLQVNKAAPLYISDEEVFSGAGEVSTDSGNDEDV